MLNNNSNNHLKLSGKNLTDLMCAVLEKNADFRFQANGHSMSPFIKNQDIVTISPLLKNKPQTGDIVAACFLERKAIVVHRIIGKWQGRLLI
ncbi:MAG: S24/S26 family peptidase, partial [Desulfobacteraceae bacterium]|nr:S24/S26 family peptidase [Desulfobacteraceae bacterium]